MFEITLRKVAGRYEDPPTQFRRFGKRWTLDDWDYPSGYTNDRRAAMKAADRINRSGLPFDFDKKGNPRGRKFSAIIVKVNIKEYPNSPLFAVFWRRKKGGK
jgi:hypothetical protein